MKTLDIIAYISEREIDLLLLEEMYVSAEFRSWFFTQVFGTSVQFAQFVAAWHSLDHSSLGESDLVIKFTDISGKMTAILVEDKIDAPPQRDQAVRYRLRGDAGIADGSWSSFRTCMTAPQAYLNQTTVEAAKYDSRISYESIRDWFLQSNPSDPRMEYKARIVQEGIDQNRRGYKRVPNVTVTNFWAEYWTTACRNYPELKMEDPGQKPARSDWAQFKSDSKYWIRHKLAKGTVELEIPSACEEIEQIASLNEHLLVDGLDLVPVGKSAAFSITIRGIDKLAPFQPQSDAIDEGLAAVSRLMCLSSQIIFEESRR